MSFLTEELKRPRRILLVVVLVILGLSVLTACGDATATVAPAVKATPTAMSNEDLARQSGASAATTVSGGASNPAAAGAATTVAGGSPVAAGTPGGTPSAVAQPTPTGVAQVEPPALVYPAAREVKLAEATNQQLIDSIGNPTEDEVVGKFTPAKVAVYFTGDDIDKIEQFFKKALDGAGWQQYSRNGNGSSTLLVYQKSGTKLIAQVGKLTTNQGLPAELTAAYKQGDNLVIIGTGTAFVPAPTPFAIPGSAILPVGAGQKKIATIEMESGEKITIELYPDIAPKTVENFEKLANIGFYNGLTFHRVEKDPQPFVVQGGDPKGDGTGGPGYSIPDEFTTQKKHIAGTVAMAHSSAANSAGSQFYITLAPATFLDGKYAIFGQVSDGMDAVNKIKKGDKMKSVKVEVK